MTEGQILRLIRTKPTLTALEAWEIRNAHADRTDLPAGRNTPAGPKLTADFTARIDAELVKQLTR